MPKVENIISDSLLKELREKGRSVLAYLILASRKINRDRISGIDKKQWNSKMSKFIENNKKRIKKLESLGF